MKPGHRLQRTLRVKPELLYEAITSRIGEWWSQYFEGRAEHSGEHFTVRFGETFKTMRIVEATPPGKVVWLCTAQRIVMPDGMAPLKNPAEWVGQTIQWNINPAPEGSQLEFFHEGLTPEVECWSVCEPGWDQTLQSLVQLLEYGTGRPFHVLDREHLARANQLNTNKQPTQ